MKFLILRAAISVLAVRGAFAAVQTWKGSISDRMCGANHKSMGHQMTNGDCALMCAKAGSPFVFVSSSHIYPLTGRAADLSAYAGRTVTITGELVGDTIQVSRVLATAVPAEGMNSYFTAINYPVPKGSLMAMLLPDYQAARTGASFVTLMGMAEYGITSRWTAGLMVEGQKIAGLPTTYGGVRFNTYFHLLPHDRLLHFTLYGEYEDLNQASLYKMEISGFGGEDLVGPLALARHTAAHTFEQRAIMYHDWGRTNVTFNFVSETALEAPHENAFGYVWGVFRQARGMDMGGMDMGAMADMPPSPGFSSARLGYGLEMMGGLGNTQQFGFDWHQEQQYLGPVFSYALSPHWSVHFEPTFGLSHVSDPFVLRFGIGYMGSVSSHRKY
jgi:hypothetical protein